MFLRKTVKKVFDIHIHKKIIPRRISKQFVLTILHCLFFVELRVREQDRDRQKMEWEMKERQATEIRQRNDIQMKQESDDMQMRMQKSEEELRRRQQENTLFMQAQQLNSMLDQAEKQVGGNRRMDSNDNRRTYDMMNQGKCPKKVDQFQLYSSVLHRYPIFTQY